MKWFKRKQTPVAQLKDRLKFAFTDQNSPKGKRNYYQFTDLTQVPVERIAKIHQLTVEISRGLTNDELGRLLDLADVHIHKGLSNPENAAKVAAIMYEMRLRRNQVMPIEVYYGYLAACYIREDEDPMRFNLQAQQEKAEAFKNASTDNDSFFFALPEYKQLCAQLNILTEGWELAINASMQAQERNLQAESILK